ncbi:phosphotransferase family protein [Gryllotalpicola reticulitermitis]|uniref:Phosphotransferase family protein n=1 Tax=Gryllotalpicola reticulitermitis TaxID=1184153 RepID=A0ABV8Q7S0_9MICO
MTGIDVPSIVDEASALMGRPLEFRRELSGGAHARTLLVRDGSDDAVVRVFPPGDAAVHHEVSVLPRLRSLGEQVPRVLGHGIAAGHPLIVTSVVAGSTPDPTVSLHRIAAQMAMMLARIHAIDPAGLRDAEVRPPEGASSLARHAHEASRKLQALERVLTHYDYWSGNALWNGDVLSGVVDWSGARAAPRGVDVAWCRQDLALLGSADAADHFLRVYEEHAGTVVSDVGVWDLVAAAHADSSVETWTTNYRGVGRPELSAPVLRQRFEEWVHAIGDGN